MERETVRERGPYGWVDLDLRSYTRRATWNRLR